MNNAIPPHALHKTRLTFVFCCAYLAAQCFMIPVLAIGHWSLWPTFSDFAWMGMVGSALLGGFHSPTASPAQVSLGRAFSLVLVIMLLWYAGFLTFDGHEIGVLDGAYNFLRMLQFVALFWIIARVPFSPIRMHIFSAVASITLFATCLGVILPYFHVIGLDQLTRHLPSAPEVAGPWTFYAKQALYPFLPQSFGTISYNHAYAGVQIITLLALRLHCAGEKEVIWNSFFMILAIFATFLCESRAALGALILYCGIPLIQKPKFLILSLPLLFFLISALNLDFMEETVHRQKAMLTATENDALSGRPIIWQAHLDHLNNNPHLWIFGGGLGACRTYGVFNTTHNQFLQVIVEFGLLGLAGFFLICFIVLKTLWKYEEGFRPIFWGSIALLVTGITQETFYPVTLFVHFLGFYLFTLSFALRRR